jgi:hypothetical protein
MKSKLFGSLMIGGLFVGMLSAQEVGDRKAIQQKRIGDGVKSGQLTPGETSHLENKEQKINKETRADRAANGGRLSPGDKRTINRDQNKVSKNIYNKKHNAAQQ